MFNVRLYLIILFGIAILLLAYLLFYLYQPAPTFSIPKQVNFSVGVCTHGNESSELFAIKDGIKYFRTDITNEQQQISLLNYEHSLGAEYLGILDYATLPNGISNKNWSLNEWNESVEEAVKSYPWISTWEIWNEPYVENFQTGFMNGSAYNYYLIIKSASTIIKSYEPNATIVCFGGAPIDSYYVFEWYARVWSYGAYRYCDAISIHAYPPGPELLNNSTINKWKEALGMYENLTGKPIWITEIGMPANSTFPGFSPSLQNKFLIQSFDLLNSIGYVKRVYWYDLWGLSDMGQNNFGLLNLTINSTPYPAWRSFLIFNNRSAH